MGAPCKKKPQDDANPSNQQTMQDSQEEMQLWLSRWADSRSLQSKTKLSWKCFRWTGSTTDEKQKSRRRERKNMAGPANQAKSLLEEAGQESNKAGQQK